MHTYSREEVYSKIHKALRHGLFQVSTLAGNTDFSVPSDVKRLQEVFLEVQAILLEHAAKEETFVFPKLEAAHPGSTRTDLLEHHDIHASLSNLADRLQDIVTVEETEDSERGFQWYLDLNRFIADYLAHMHDEETVTANLVRETLSFPELMQVQGAIVGSMTPAESARSLRYMIPALYHSERVKFLQGIQAMAPEPMFLNVMNIAEAALSPFEFNSLSEALLPMEA